MDKEPEGSAVAETLRLKGLAKALDNGLVVPQHINREAVLLDCVRHLIAAHGEDETVRDVLGWLE